MIELPVLDDRSHELWTSLIELSELQQNGWTLIGAQMVLLHALGHGRTPPRRSEDLDVLFDVRTLTRGPRVLTSKLEAAGFEFLGATPDGVGHRFARRGVDVDVLVPDNLGNRANRNVAPGVRTVEVPGGTQALRRSEDVAVTYDGRTGTVPRPSLLGAILIKARAVEVDDLPDAQREDLAFLLTLVPDPYDMADDISDRERKWLLRRAEMFDQNGRAWRRVQDAEDGRLALRILVRSQSLNS